MDDIQVSLVILNLHVVVNNWATFNILKFHLIVRPREQIKEMKTGLLTAYNLLQFHWLDYSHYKEVL